ncbi:MAG: uroporphyrinogen-III C-methyltransferase [Desulfobacterales bacterium]
MNPATVYLVGAGPGDPGLITLRGVECLGRAEVVVYDHLAAPELLRHAPPGAERIYAGKQAGDHALSQERINALLVDRARAGKTVVRLKGGDPFVFGRGGEEAEALARAGIPFEVVPGVTSAVAAPAYAGIPLSHRRLTSTISLVTGHEDPAKPGSGIDWECLARGGGTLVFLMGVNTLPAIASALTAHGRDPATPAAVVRWGTTPRQQTVTGTLADIAARAREAGIRPPALIVVGEVVRLREQLRWFERRPLFGLRIVVTRAREQASDLLRRLSALGAECLETPAIRIAPPADWRPLDAAIAELPATDWVVFTSVNGVDSFFQRLEAAGRDARALAGVKTAAIGPATAERLRRHGILSDLVPETYRAEAVVEAFRREALSGRIVLLPRAAEARPVLPRELSALGAVVREVEAYRTLPAETDPRGLLARLEERTLDLITFTSSSTVTHFLDLLPPARLPGLIAGIPCACIGPITAETARRAGLQVAVEAPVYTIEGLVEAILAWARTSRGGP